MGFGVSFIRWVRLLIIPMSVAPSLLMVVSVPLGHLAECVKVALYLCSCFLSIEVLAANIRCNPAVSGLRLPGISSPLHVLYLYGDDTSVFSCANCATKVFFAVSHHGFEKGTGAKVNSGE